jgi:signal transduction histidine kinase
MINDILDLSRIEGRLLDLDEDAVNIQEAVTVACNAILEDKPDAPAVDIDIPAHLPLLRVDARRLHQILTHLLSNAVKFTPSEGRISMRAALASDGALAIRIADSGIGMEPERIEHALEPFKQLDSRIARRFEGVGLGLPLANALVRAHDGTLSVESAPGKGTIVTVSFPPERNIEIARAAAV